MSCGWCVECNENSCVLPQNYNSGVWHVTNIEYNNVYITLLGPCLFIWRSVAVYALETSLMILKVCVHMFACVFVCGRACVRACIS